MNRADALLCRVATAAIEDAITRLGRLHGLPQLAARIYAIALLSDDGISRAQLEVATGSAAGDLAPAIHSLSAAGLVTSRGDRLEASLEPWSGLAAWRRVRSVREIAALRALGNLLAPGSSEGDVARALRAKLARVEALSIGFELMGSVTLPDRSPDRRVIIRVIGPAWKRRAPRCRSTSRRAASGSGTRTPSRFVRRPP